MLKLLTLDPDKFYTQLSLLKDFFERKFPEPKKSKKPQGAPRKWPRWLIMALGLIGAGLDFNWEEYTLQLKKIEHVLFRFGAKEAPKKTSLYNAWRKLTPGQIKKLTSQIADLLVEEGEDSAIDSTGFLLKTGGVWILVKYKRSELKRSSKRFYKFHIMVSTKTKVVLGVNWSKSPKHDFPEGRKIIKQVGKAILNKITRNYGDKAYNGKPLTDDLAEFGVRHIVEPKSNAVDHGTDTQRDRSLRLYKNSPALWKHTFRHGRKSAVEQVFGEIKIAKNGINSRRRHLLKKQILLQFLLYNLDKVMELENLR